ncbi:hypothetical protein D3C72_895170 [compost metagenome]
MLIFNLYTITQKRTKICYVNLPFKLPFFIKCTAIRCKHTCNFVVLHLPIFSFGTHYTDPIHIVPVCTTHAIRTSKFYMQYDLAHRNVSTRKHSPFLIRIKTIRRIGYYSSFVMRYYVCGICSFCLQKRYSKTYAKNYCKDFESVH